MKLTLSYDLADKINEANKGYSLKKYASKVAEYTGISSTVGTALNLANGAPPEEYFIDVLFYLAVQSMIIGMYTSFNKENIKEQATSKLIELIPELRDINIPANIDSLLNARLYKTEYKSDFKNKIIEQKKYINVPVNDFWGEREISLCQEHAIGSGEWELSVGEPKKSKVYTLGKRKAPNV